MTFVPIITIKIDPFMCTKVIAIVAFLLGEDAAYCSMYVSYVQIKYYLLTLYLFTT